MSSYANGLISKLNKFLYDTAGSNIIISNIPDSVYADLCYGNFEVFRIRYTNPYSFSCFVNDNPSNRSAIDNFKKLWSAHAIFKNFVFVCWSYAVALSIVHHTINVGDIDEL